MGKIRVYQVAKELGIESKELVSRVIAMGIDVRNYMSSLDSEDVVRVKRAFEKQRHEEMVEEEIKPGVTRRRSIRPRAQPRKPAPPAPLAVSASPAPIAPVPQAPVRKKAATAKQQRREPAVPPPPESAVIPTARPKALQSTPLQPSEAKAEESMEAAEARPEPAPPSPSVEQSEPSAAIAPSTANQDIAETAAETAELEPAAEAPVSETPPKPEPPRSKEPPVIEDHVEPPPRPEPPRSRPRAPAAPATPASAQPEVPARPEPPQPPARPEPPVSKRLNYPQDNRQFIDLPPRPPERPASGDAFPLGPPSQSKNKRGRRQEVQPRDLRGNRQMRSGPRARPPRKKRAPVGKKSRQTEITVPKESKRVIRIEATITLQELAKRMGVKATEVIVKLMEMGVGGIHINSMLDADMAKIIAEEFHYQVEDVSVSEEDLLAAARQEEDKEEAPKEDLEPRAPVVTMLGHVDHGKTSLLDKIRETRVAKGEAGGITQHIGAYQVDTAQGVITFIDTPGHEAFTAMRARGAMATDVAILVVAADDGVMPTTKEAISHVRAAETPIVVALNKMDIEDANPDLALRGLAEEGLQPEEWGGDTVVCKVSARTGEGLDHLLEMILLSSEMLELRANPKDSGHGVVLEAKLEKGRGPVSTVLVQNGTLRAGDYVVAGGVHGKIRAMGDPTGRKLDEAGPSVPVELLGLSGVPLAGDPVDAVADSKKGEQLAAMRSKAASAAAVPPSSAISDIIKQIQKGNLETDIIETVNLVIKGDVQGSVEAIKEKVISLTTEEVEVKVIHAGVGGITESDVLLASASDPKAVIIGFNVRPAGKARSMAEREHVELRFHSIIYELLDDTKDLMLGRLRPTIKEVDLGRVEVRKLFHIPKIGVIAGCHVLDGKVLRNAYIRLVRDSVEIWKGKLGSLKRFNEDVKEVAAGFECGIRLEGYNDLKENDIIEAFETEEIAPTL